MKSIKRESMAKLVVDQMIGLLKSGELKPGDKLPSEPELSDMLYVSRPVLREALSSLEMMGILRRKTRKGTYFAEKIGSKPYSIMLALSARDVPSMLEARMALELGLVTMAAEKITDEQLQSLTELHERLSSSKEDYTSIDKEFHRTIAYSANNPILEGSIDPLLNMFDETLRQIPSNDRDHQATAKEHLAILEALARRDPTAAHAGMYAHLSHVRRKVLKSLQ